MLFQRKRYKKLQEENRLLKQEISHLRATSTQGIINEQFPEANSADISCSPATLFKTLLNALPHSIYFKDLRSRIFLCNESMAKKHSQFNSEQEMIGKTDFDLFTQEHAEQAYRDEQKIIKTQKPLLNIIERETWANKQDTWVSTNKFPLHNEWNELIGTFGISVDITELKNTQADLEKAHRTLEEKVNERTKELTENQKKHQLITDNSFDIIMQIDPEGRFIYASPKIKTIMGYTPEELIGEPIIDYVDSEHKQELAQKFKDLLNGSTSKLNIISARTKSGEKVWLDISISPVLIDQKPDSFVCIARDITDTIDANNQLNLLKRAVENSPVSIIITNTNGVIEYVNSKFIELTGYSEDEAIGKTPAIQKSGKMDDKIYSELWETVSKGEEWRGELLNRKKNGDLYWELASISAVKNQQGDTTHFIAVKEDITQEKNRIEERKAEEARLKSIISMMLLNFDDENTLLKHVLEEAIRLTNSKIGFIYHYQEENQTFILNSWSKEVMQQCSIIEPRTTYELSKTGIWGEVVRQRKAIMVNDMKAFNPQRKGYPPGHAELTRFLSIPVFEKDKIVATVGVANKKEEYTTFDELQLELLMNSVWILVSRIRINNELKNKNIDLLELNNQRDKLFSIVSHDLRSPFMALINLSQIINENYDTLSEKEIKEYLGLITDGSEKTFNLLENLLEWSKSKRGLINYNPTDINLTEVCNHIINNMNAQFKVKNIEVTAELTKPVFLYADKDMVNSIFRNLLSNAVKFSMPDGKIKITAKNKGKMVEVCVEDNGVGMNIDTANNLFTSESITSQAGSNGEKGSGLGLVLCKEFVEYHKGDIWVKSAVGKGSKFHFTLPSFAST
ncbi:PAS domain S-box protein [Alkalitalea saponilacus]|uniref:histidine kinase n=1 Tax=Alkalitalea saponilacus TaxID=889453 RepID=A0A1T5BU74_9BACT|nr:PAS domain S-box protein [Alkalitalea saponilacus]ASB49589.1 hypothetical protein CDL62_10770 [Alkalitalea saponilacus]SKB50902.1 PAS domain S-box-containing protein [Alkalitalea saponilacus]